MGKLNFKKVKSATLVETLVALLIILVITAITVTVIVQITVSGYSMQRIKAEALIERYINDAQNQKTFIDEDFQEGEFIVRKQIVENNSTKKFCWLRFSVFAANNKQIKNQNVFLLMK